MKCAINDTVAYIKLLAQDMAGCDPDYVILAILLDLSIPVNYAGFEYLKSAILMQYEDLAMDHIHQIYDALATRYRASMDTVVFAMRGAIKAAWQQENREKWYRYLPTVPAGRYGAPTNAEVIVGLARIVELWQGCAEAYLRQQSKEVVSCGRE